jgi:hypothetical protein
MYLLKTVHVSSPFMLYDGMFIIEYYNRETKTTSQFVTKNNKAF